VDLTEKVQELSSKYKKHVRVISIYTREFHAEDGWSIPHNNVCFFQPRTIEQRSKIAQEFLEKTANNSKRGAFYELWLDTMDNRAAIEFKSEPERLYIVKGKKIAMVGGIGPDDYDPWHVEKWLIKELGY